MDTVTRVLPPVASSRTWSSLPLPIRTVHSACSRWSPSVKSWTYSYTARTLVTNKLTTFRHRHLWWVYRTEWSSTV